MKPASLRELLTIAAGSGELSRIAWLLQASCSLAVPNPINLIERVQAVEAIGVDWGRQAGRRRTGVIEIYRALPLART